MNEQVEKEDEFSPSAANCEIFTNVARFHVATGNLKRINRIFRKILAKICNFIKEVACWVIENCTQKVFGIIKNANRKVNDEFCLLFLYLLKKVLQLKQL